MSEIVAATAPVTPSLLPSIPSTAAALPAALPAAPAPSLSPLETISKSIKSLQIKSKGQGTKVNALIEELNKELQSMGKQKVSVTEKDISLKKSVVSDAVVSANGGTKKSIQNFLTDYWKIISVGFLVLALICYNKFKNFKGGKKILSSFKKPLKQTSVQKPASNNANFQHKERSSPWRPNIVHTRVQTPVSSAPQTVIVEEIKEEEELPAESEVVNQSADPNFEAL